MFSVITTACINNLAVQELNNKAAEYLEKGDAKTAISRLQASLDLDNAVYQTHYNLSAAYHSAGEYDKSIEEAHKALELKPDLYDAYYMAAASYEAAAYKSAGESSDLNGALEPIEQSLNINQEEFNKKLKSALDNYNKYLEYKPDAPDKDQIREKIIELNEKLSETLNENTAVKSEEE